jgi:thiol-disulfide isomerase/thioredoxin
MQPFDAFSMSPAFIQRLILLIVLCPLVVQSLHSAENVNQPAPAPLKFTSRDGQEVDLTQMGGKVVLLDFWAMWCGPCIREHFALRPLYQKYHASGFEIVGVYCDNGSASELTTFLTKYGMTWPQHFGGELKDPASVAQQFGINELPTTFLIGRDGKLIGRNIRGSALEPALRQAIGLAPENSRSVKP